MAISSRKARSGARSTETAPRPAWRPAKITYDEVYSLSAGGRTTRRMSLPAISMHIAAWREEKKAFTLYGGEAA